MVAKKVTVPAKYFDFAIIFSKKLAKMLSKYIGIIKHAIKLVDDKQSLYRSICNLEPIELKTLKIYMKIYLANSFTRLLKSFISIFIFFVCKPNHSLHLYVDYQGLNNLIIKT